MRNILGRIRGVFGLLKLGKERKITPRKGKLSLSQDQSSASRGFCNGNRRSRKYE